MLIDIRKINFFISKLYQKIKLGSQINQKSKGFSCTRWKSDQLDGKGCEIVT